MAPDLNKLKKPQGLEPFNFQLRMGYRQTPFKIPSIPPVSTSHLWADSACVPCCANLNRTQNCPIVQPGRQRPLTEVSLQLSPRGFSIEVEFWEPLMPFLRSSRSARRSSAHLRPSVRGVPSPACLTFCLKASISVSPDGRVSHRGCRCEFPPKNAPENPQTPKRSVAAQ